MGLKDILIKIGTAFDAKGSKAAQEEFKQVEQRAVEAEKRAAAAEKELKNLQEQAKKTAAATSDALKPVSTPPDTKGAEAAKEALKQVETQAKQTRQAVASAYSDNPMSMMGKDAAPLPGSYRYKEMVGDAKKAAEAIREMETSASKSSLGDSLFGGKKSAGLEAHDSELLASAAERIAAANARIASTDKAKQVAGGFLDSITKPGAAKAVGELAAKSEALGIHLSAVGGAAANIAVVAGAAKLAADEIGNIETELKKVAPEVARQNAVIFELAHAVAHPLEAAKEVVKGTAAAIGEEWRKLVDKATGGVYTQIKALAASNALLEKTKQQWENAKEARQIYKDQFIDNTIEGKIRRETDELDKLAEAQARDARRRASEKEVSDAQGDLEDARAIRAGGDPQQVAFNRFVQQGQATITEQEQGIADTQKRLEELRGKIEQNKEDAEKLQVEASASFNQSTEKQTEIKGKLKALGQEFNNLATQFDTEAKQLYEKQADLKDSKAKLGVQIQSKKEELEAAISSKLDESNKSATEKLIADIQSGAVQLNSNGKAALDGLIKVVGDNIPDSKQMDQLQKALQGITDGTTQGQEAVLRVLGTVATQNQAFARRLEAIEQKVSGL